MSETGNLKLKKHDNPETNEEKFDVDNYLNGNWDKIDEYTKEVETELKEMQEDFYQFSKRGKASGEYIHVEDSSGVRCVIGIKGNHKQETREGYNKLDENNLIDVTIEGVNISYSDGKIKISGTCTLATGQRLATYIPVTLEKGTYLFSCFGDYEYKYFTLRDNSNNYIQNLIQYNITGNQSREITVTETTTYRISIHILAGKVYNNEINLMINEGTVEKNYESFGVMPSTNYPSEIKTVGSNGTIKVTIENVDKTNGQNYIMPVQQEMLEGDYFDWDNEEEVHMWDKIESYNGEIITTDYISTTGELTTGAIVYYKLTTPTQLPFTEEQKMVAKEIHNARTYKNVTNITTDNIAILDLDYVKDPEIEHNKMQNEIDEIKQLLSTTQTSALLLDNLQKEVESEVE